MALQSDPNKPLDSKISWVRRSFMVPRLRGNAINENARKRQWYATKFQLYGLSATKFTDTTLGGNFCINPHPQFHIGADIPVPRFTGNSNSGSARYQDLQEVNEIYGALSSGNSQSFGRGMGRLYSEVFDDQNQIIYLRFGKPEFNGITTFFTGFYNSEASLLARTGRVPGLTYSLGKVLGGAAALPFTIISSLFALGRWVAGMPASKYYYLRQTMPLYWKAANTILNSINVNTGIYNPPVGDEEKQYIEANVEDFSGLTGTVNSQLYANLLPDVFLANGGIDLYRVTNRAASASHVHFNNLEQTLANINQTGMQNIGETILSTMINSVAVPDSRGIDAALQAYIESPEGQEIPPTESHRPTEQTNSDGGVLGFTWGWLKDLKNNMKAELADGSQFLGLRVEFGGTVGESFSTSTRPSDIQSNFNSTASGARNARFNFSEGNVGGVVGGVLKPIQDTIKDFTTGVIDGIQMSGLFALAGSAFVDIPEQVDQSMANLPSMNYNIHLRAWSGDPYTIMQCIDVPLSCILAGILPHSTGKSSYGPPFIAELYHKGWAQSRLCVCTSASITRGTGNIGWNTQRRPLGVDISLEFKDLSSIMHMPIISGFSLNPFNNVFADDNIFNDYLAVVSGLGLADQIYLRRRFGLAKSRLFSEMRKWTSPAYHANWLNGSTLTGQFFNAISREMGRP